MSNAIATDFRCGNHSVGCWYPSFYLAFYAQNGGTPPAFVAMVKHTDRRPPVHPKTANQLLNLLEADDTEIFEIDRYGIVLHLRSLRRAIDEGAEEMEMVSAERVFDESLSRELDREARKLRSTTRDLNRLIGLVERAQVAKETRRPKPKPKTRLRRK